ncbi:amino acid ABC transporter ATP-binding/permease protein [Eubacteriales bacterium KG127]
MRNRSGIEVMLELIVLVKPLTIYMIAAIVLGLLGYLSATFITILGGLAITSLLGLTKILNLKIIFIFLGIFGVMRGIFRYGEQECNHYIAFKLLALIRNKIFVALRTLCPAKLETRDKGDLVAVITSDIELLEVFYAHTISPTAIAILFSIIMVVFIGSYHFVLGIITAASYVVIGIVLPHLTSKKSGDIGANLRNKSGALSAKLLDNLRGLSEIIQYNQGESKLNEINRISDELSVEESKYKGIIGECVALTNSGILTCNLLMIIVTIILYNSGKVDFTGIIIPTIALMSSFGPCIALANLGGTLQTTFAAGNRVLNILEEKPQTPEVSGEKVIKFDGACFKNVDFSYKGDESIGIIQGVYLNIPKDSAIGLVGKSGSGKSTILKLLMRFWDTSAGQIEISKKNITEINTEDLRNMESYVTQETYIFRDTIKNNIKIAKLDAMDEEIVTACKKASIHDFIVTLPNGYDSQIGELGATLSGGEKQRIGLARAFLHDASLMLLDEPTSNLDTINESIILKSLYKEKQGKTIIMVSHRGSTMKIVDKIYSVTDLSETGNRSS